MTRRCRSGWHYFHLLCGSCQPNKRERALIEYRAAQRRHRPERHAPLFNPPGTPRKVQILRNALAWQREWTLFKQRLRREHLERCARFVRERNERWRREAEELATLLVETGDVPRLHGNAPHVACLAREHTAQKRGK